MNLGLIRFSWFPLMIRFFSWPVALTCNLPLSSLCNIETMCWNYQKSAYTDSFISSKLMWSASHVPEKQKCIATSNPALTDVPEHQSALFSSVQLCGTQSSPKWFNTVPFKLVFISKEVFTPRPQRSQKKFILSVLVHFIFCSIAYHIFVSVGQHYLQLQLTPQLGVTPWSTPWSHKPGFNTIFFN